MDTFNAFAGAADCTVVTVVVKERTLGAGDENVLPAPPMPFELKAPPAVLTVPAFDCPSECVVSAFVDTVGAEDLTRWLACSSREIDVDARL